MSVRPIPDGYHSITPYLMINGAAEAIQFYRRAFGAKELFKMDAPIMMADDCGGESPFSNPHSVGGSPVGLHLYVEDVDAVFAQAVSEGATVIKPVKDQFYGDRTGALKDPFGHIWFLATHKEELSPDEIKQRAEAMFKQSGPDTAPAS